jgi:hypothetical protein
VSSACESKSCHRFGGKVIREAEKMAIRWFLAVRIAHSFRRERAMVVGRDVLKTDGDRAKERGEVRRSLVVEEKMGERVRKGAKKGDDRLKGRHVGRGSEGHHGVQVDVPMMQDDE